MVLYAIEKMCSYSEYVRRYIGKKRIDIDNIKYIWKPKMRFSL